MQHTHSRKRPLQARPTRRYGPALPVLLMLLILFGMAAPAMARDDLVYPYSGKDQDSRYDYDWAVLRSALEKTRPRFGPYSLRQAGQGMSPQRISHELSQPGGRINILVRASTPELELQLLPIRIPVDKGLLGYRVFLVRRASLPQFAAVRTLAGLRALRAGQGKDWADVTVLRAAGLETVEGSDYEGLFAMLENGRFDFFSRSVDEGARELGERADRHPQLALEPTLLLHYPLPRYFFVRRDAGGQRLAARIAAGLEIMLADGTLDALFFRYKGELIERVGLGRRRLLEIPNPTLTPQTPLARSELWYRPPRQR